MRTRQEVAYSIFKLKQALRLQNVLVDDKSIRDFAEHVMAKKVQTAVEQIIESWPIGDVHTFIQELESPQVPQSEALIHEKPMNRDNETTKRKPKGHKLSS